MSSVRPSDGTLPTNLSLRQSNFGAGDASVEGAPAQDKLLATKKVEGNQQVADDAVDVALLILRNAQNNGVEFDPAAEISNNSIYGENRKA